MKIQVDEEILCSDLPYEFIDYLKIVKNYSFYEDPNYEFLKNLFANLIKKYDFEVKNIFNWKFINKNKKKIYSKSNQALKSNNQTLTQKNSVNLN